ncbi:META domain-containing protein [Myroides sp. LJL115]
MKRNLILLAAFLSLSVISCKTVPTNTMENQTQDLAIHNELQGKWVLESMSDSFTEGKSLKDLFPGKTPSLNFDTEKNTLNGNDGCNNIFGAYQVSGVSGLSIGEHLGSTMMACQGVSDFVFKKALSEITSFKIQDHKLQFYSGDVLLMSFKHAHEKQAPTEKIINLEGTQWVLSFIQPLDRSMKTIEDRFPMGLPTLNFDTTNINGNTGCNVFNGEFKADNGQLSFDKVAMTRRFCDGVEENLFTSNLNAVTQYKEVDGELVLSNADDMVVLRFKKN